MCSPLINAALLFHLVSDHIYDCYPLQLSHPPPFQSLMYIHRHTHSHAFLQACKWRPATHTLSLHQSLLPVLISFLACGPEACVQTWLSRLVQNEWLLSLVPVLPFSHQTRTQAGTDLTRMHRCPIASVHTCTRHQSTCLCPPPQPLKGCLCGCTAAERTYAPWLKVCLSLHCYHDCSQTWLTYSSVFIRGKPGLEEDHLNVI